MYVSEIQHVAAHASAPSAWRVQSKPQGRQILSDCFSSLLEPPAQITTPAAAQPSCGRQPASAAANALMTSAR